MITVTHNVVKFYVGVTLARRYVRRASLSLESKYMEAATPLVLEFRAVHVPRASL